MVEMFCSIRKRKRRKFIKIKPRTLGLKCAESVHEKTPCLRLATSFSLMCSTLPEPGQQLHYQQNPWKLTVLWIGIQEGKNDPQN
jgi:hypothetical protein